MSDSDDEDEDDVICAYVQSGGPEVVCIAVAVAVGGGQSFDRKNHKN